VLVAPHEDCHAVRADLEALLASRGITHATLQVDHAPGESSQHCEDTHGPSYWPPGADDDTLPPRRP